MQKKYILSNNPHTLCCIILSDTTTISHDPSLCETFPLKFLYTYYLYTDLFHFNHHSGYVKSVKIWSFSWSVFSRARIEY